MKTMPVGEFKAHFSEALTKVQHGEEIAISFGRKKEKVAVIVPYNSYVRKKRRKLGVLAQGGEFELADDFKMTDEEMLGL